MRRSLTRRAEPRSSLRIRGLPYLSSLAFKELLHVRAELLVGDRPGTRRSGGVRVVALSRDAQEPTEGRDREVGLLRVNEGEFHSLSFADGYAWVCSRVRVNGSEGALNPRPSSSP